VPHVLLVDTHGKIVFVGHPASRKLEEDIDTLLKGEKITGAGTSKGGGDDEDEGGSKTIDAATFTSLTGKFQEGCKKACDSKEVQTAAKNC